MLLALCVGNSLVTSEFPSQRPVMWSFDVFFDLLTRIQLRSWNNGVRCMSFYILMKLCTCVYWKRYEYICLCIWMSSRVDICASVYFDRYFFAQYSFAHPLNEKTCGDMCRCVFLIFTYAHLLLIWDDNFVFLRWIFGCSQNTDRPLHVCYSGVNNSTKSYDHVICLT